MKHFLILLLVLSSVRTPAERVSFSREVAPLLQRHCVACHKEGKAKGKYRLDTYEELRKELEPGDLESELLFRLTTEDEEERMPAEADPLPPAEIDVIRKWVKEGAKYDGSDPKAPLASVIPVKDHPSSPPSPHTSKRPQGQSTPNYLRFFEYVTLSVPRPCRTRACHGRPRAWHAAPLHTCHACGAVRLPLAWVAM